ncbi:MAG TPA: MFS transporter [Candidatus Sulfotelmatobacter sp.]|jgi:predicted MFS family arabinose efflux permease|nr:MFS transporter [Candidatus Sulfotelmatobacter sp.]
MTPAPAQAASARDQQIATRIGFFIGGFGVSAWAPLVPYAKARLGLEDGTLGLLLLCLGAGSLLTMPLTGPAAARFGCRKVLVVAAAALCLTLPFLTILDDALSLGTALFLFGGAVGSVDCVINIQAVMVEKASGRPMMSGFHGLFSLGGIAGAGGVSLLLMAGLSPSAVALAVVAILITALLRAKAGFLPYGAEGQGPIFAIPRGAVLFIGVLCFVAFLTEGAMLDWSAVFLTSLRRLDPSRAGMAYACFAGAMTAGRLTGDAIVRSFGPLKVVAVGGVLAAGGLATAIAASSWIAGLIGFALVGAGCSNIVPVLYTAVGRQDDMPDHIAVPAISTLGYAGILAGPAAIGFVAHSLGLTAALLIVAVMMTGVSLSTRWLKA